MSIIDKTYEGKTAIITGAASGIGLAITRKLASVGATVVLADMQIELAQSIAKEIQDVGGNAWAVELNVSDTEAFKSIAADTKEKTGHIDYIFNNAGIAINGGVKDSEIEDWKRTFDTNVMGVVNGVLAIYPIMIEQGFGHIVNTASIGGIVPTPGATAYTASKFAVNGLTQSLRVEASFYGVKVSSLLPGMVDTPLLEGGKYGRLAKGMTPQAIRQYFQKLHLATPDEIAPKILTQVAKNKGMIVVPGRWKRIIWLYRFSWNTWYRISRKRFGRTVKFLTAALQDQNIEKSVH